MMSEGEPGRTERAPGDGTRVDGPAAGSVFGGLEIEAEIGRGGMGVIYRARDPALEQIRALKVLAAGLSGDPGFRERFRRESRLAASIEHPNVAPVYQAGEQEGHLYLVMRFVDGPSLHDRLAEQPRLSPEHALALTRQIAAALDAAHARGLIHRDVKPANILLEGEPGAERAFLCDFGISKLASAATELTTTGQFLGTVDYVAPEQIAGDPVDRRTDVYSLACVLFHAVTGAPPFTRQTQLATLFAHANAPRPRASEVAPDLPRDLDGVLAQGMAQEPADRFASAGELAAAAEEAIGGDGRRGPTAAPTERIPRRRRSRRPIVLGAIAVAALAAAGIAIALSGGGSGSPKPAPEVPSVKTAAPIKVSQGPIGLTVGPERVWVASSTAHEVTSIDPAERRVTSQVPVSGAPTSVAVGFDSLWIVNRSADAVVRADPLQGTSTTIPVGRAPTDVAVSEKWVWVTDSGDDSVSRIDPTTNAVTATTPVGPEPDSVAASGDDVWVTNLSGKSLSRIDAETADTVGKPLAVGQRPNDVAIGGGSVWVIDNFNGTLTRIDPKTMRVAGDPIEVGAKPRGVSAGLGYVWVANGGDGTVDRVDPQTAQVFGAPIPVGDDPADIAVGDGAVWTANFGDSTVTELRP